MLDEHEPLEPGALVRVTDEIECSGIFDESIYLDTNSPQNDDSTAGLLSNPLQKDHQNLKSSHANTYLCHSEVAQELRNVDFDGVSQQKDDKYQEEMIDCRGMKGTVVVVNGSDVLVGL